MEAYIEEVPVDIPVHEGTHTVHAAGATLMMHMPGSIYSDCPDFLRTYSPEAIRDSPGYVHMPYWEIYEEAQFNIERRFGPGSLDATHFVMSATKNDKGEMVLGARMFALLLIKLSSGGAEDDFQLAVGIRSSIDGSGRLLVCVGNLVFVCDNMSFTGELMMGHRHTKNIVNASTSLIADIIRKAEDQFFADMDLKKALQGHTCNHNDGIDILTRMWKQDILEGGNAKTSQLGMAIREWEQPSYSVFNKSNAWALMNAATYGTTRSSNMNKAILNGSKVTTFFRELVA